MSMAAEFAFRVVSWSEPGRLHKVTAGVSVHCDCTGFGISNFCRHIDATLVSGERFMVHEDDRAVADQAMKAMAGKLVPPEGWQATWRRDYRWRGLHRKRPSINPRTSGKPLVAFTGTLRGPDGIIRLKKFWKAEAKANGWDVADSPSPFTDVLVAEDPMSGSAKLRTALANFTVIVSADEWPELMRDGVLPED